MVFQHLKYRDCIVINLPIATSTNVQTFRANTVPNSDAANGSDKFGL